MADQPGAHELADERRQVRRDRRHAVAQIRVQLRTVLADGNHLVTQAPDVLHVRVAHLGTHRDLGGGLERLLELLREDLGEVRRIRVGPEAHGADHAGVGNVVRDDLAHLGEVPAVPLLHTHRIDVQLLVEVVEQGNRLHDHDVHLLGAELELVPAEAVRKTKAHRAQVAGVQRALVRRRGAEQRREVLADPTVQVHEARLGRHLDPELLVDRRGQLGLRHNELLGRVLLGARGAALLKDLLLQEALEALAQLAFIDRGRRFHGLDRALEAVDRRELQQAVRLCLTLKVLVELGRAQLRPIGERKEAEAHGCLKEHQHHRPHTRSAVVDRLVTFCDQKSARRQNARPAQVTCGACESAATGTPPCTGNQRTSRIPTP